MPKKKEATVEARLAKLEKSAVSRDEVQALINDGAGVNLARGMGQAFFASLKYTVGLPVLGGIKAKESYDAWRSFDEAEEEVSAKNPAKQAPYFPMKVTPEAKAAARAVKVEAKAKAKKVKAKAAALAVKAKAKKAEAKAAEVADNAPAMA